MVVVLRLISLVLIFISIMLIGADLVTSLEKGGMITVRSIEQIWDIFSKTGVASFKGWLEHTLPTPVPSWIEALLRIPGWAITGVPGVFLAFIFGRRAGGD